ncbi:MAG TPA: serine/threonine-protein kinase [Urbifossiella sp.]|nr:serine/threonine-protein kinase [Urbifossiella sp.]
MPIACPYCKHRINLKAAKPGRYRPRCPKCERPFALEIPKDGVAYRAEVLADDATFANRESANVAQSPVAVAAGANKSHIFGYSETNPELHCASNSDAGDADSDPAAERESALPRSEFKGYRIMRELGRGGMGAVFLAQQLSLNRPVALKVMAKRWTSDATFVARFTREAFAAAQLSHPNIVHIHDIGEVDGSRFFSMEFVPGRSLADLIRVNGKLDPETAVGYILQAARGLKHAHDRGMIHRDVKPDNMLLNDQGLVKVADLGLVKTPALSRDADALSGSQSGLQSLPADMTGARIALGTPAYMSPEQCRDAAAVDHRADIYSLGCTLYVLVTGRTPFQGTTAIELMTKQAYEPIVPPERIVARVPPELSAVIQRMMAKSPGDRYQSMDEVIRTLEAWLGIRSGGSYCPREEEITRLEGIVHAYNTAPKAVLRTRVLQGYLGVVFFTSILLLFFGRAGWSLGVISLLVQSALAYFVIDGVANKGPLFSRVRQFLWGLSWWDWGIALAGVGLFALLLAMSGLFWMWLGFGIIGVGLAVGVHVGLDWPIAVQRREPLEDCEKLLRRLRAQALDEEDLRTFAAKFSGRHWEGMFEAVFGYEAKLAARAALVRGGSAGPREKHAAWREPILNAIDRIERARKEARERRMLAAVERARLIAEGAAQAEADRKAKETADAMIRTAEAYRVHIGASTPQAPASTEVRSIMSGASKADFAFVAPKADPLGRFISLAVGKPTRAILAAALLAACAVWAQQNGLLPGSEVQEQVQAAVESNDLGELQATAALDQSRATSPLAIDGVPPRLTQWVDSFNVGIAGLMLLGSLAFRGNAMALLVIVGAAIAATGHHLGIRTVEPISNYHIALLLGSVIALIGFRCRQR